MIILMLGGIGCSYIRLQQSLSSRPTDWVMYGGNAGRLNLAHEVLQPPLSMAWEYDASAGFGPSSAVAADSFLFVGNLQGEVHAVRISDGKGAGVFDFGSAIVGTPVLDRDLLYVVLAHDEESVIAYNLRFASIKWKAKIGDVESSPLILDKRLYVTTLTGKLVCLEKNDGMIAWTYELPSHVRTRIIHSSPASDSTLIVFGCDNGSVYAVGANDGKLRWSINTRKSVVASPSISRGKVFIGSLDSTLYALDVSTGKQLWAQPLGAKIYSSQAVDHNRVYVGTVGRTIYCLDAENGTIIWKVNTNGVINSPPLISGNVVYVGCIDKVLYALQGETGDVLWQFRTEGRIKTMPIISKNYLFVLAEDRSVIAFTHSGAR